MKRNIFLILLATVLSVSCEKALMEDDEPSDKMAVFEYLWTKFDQNYSLFNEKNINWDSVHDVYAPRVAQTKNAAELFRVLSDMVNTLEDAHVNLYNDFDVSHDARYFVRSHQRCNIDINVVALNYLTSNYHSTGGFAHNTIRDGKVLYVRYSSFSNSITTADWIHVLSDNYSCRGTILDMRQNGGGSIENIWTILKLMPSTGQTLYFTQLKNGPGHDDFGELEERKAPENDEHEPYRKPVVVLVDRGSYSATSFFALCTKSYSNMTLMGDTTGGGLGMPAGGQLPNGWYYRLSVTRTLPPVGPALADGVPPDNVVLLDAAETAAGRDNVIEAACDWIMSR